MFEGLYKIIVSVEDFDEIQIHVANNTIGIDIVRRNETTIAQNILTSLQIISTSKFRKLLTRITVINFLSIFGSIGPRHVSLSQLARSRK